MQSNKINLLVFDEEEHYEKNLPFLGKNIFKSIHRVKTIKDVEAEILNFGENELIFLIVH